VPSIVSRHALPLLTALTMSACGTSEVIVEVPAGFNGVVVLVSDHAGAIGSDLDVQVPATGACRVERLPARSAMRVCEQASRECRRLPVQPGTADWRHVFGVKVGNRGGAHRDDRTYYLAFAVGTAAERERLTATVGARVREALDRTLAPCP
jgi:hypothetical protein